MPASAQRLGDLSLSDIQHVIVTAVAFPNSYRSASRAQSPWLIPVTDLIAAGLTPGKPAPPEEPPGPAEPSPTELDALKAENVELRKRAEIAEAVAEEREKALEDTRLALRALSAGEAVKDRKRWWRRS